MNAFNEERMGSKKGNRRAALMKTVLLGGMGLGVLGAVALAVAFVALSRDLPTLSQISERRVSQSTKIYDRDETTLLYEISGGEKRTVIPFVEIPQPLKDATIAVEDERFYEEPAFDWRGYLRAFLVNLRHREIRQGGSTITIQLARNAFLTSEQTVLRKLRELLLAVRLGRQYTKDHILGLYLNEIPYGPSIYGVEAASRAYFNKPVRDVSIAESAVLAALPRAPSYYSPWGSHVKELLSRQQFILKKMFDLGKIDEEQFSAASEAKIAFQPQGKGLKAPHFIMAVQDYLVKKYGEDLVRTGGLRVRTTLDAALQEAAERAVSEGAKRNEELYKGTNAALVAEDPKTGHILALVGSRDYFDIEAEGNFDVATQGLRQPGSALKPFAYLVGFIKGYTPETVLFDVPTEFAAQNENCPPEPDFLNDDPQCFHPENFDERFRGPVNLRTALAQSINVPSVKMLYLAGLEDTIRMLQEFGVDTLTNPARYGLSLVLGGGEVKLADLVEAYTVLAQDGVWHKPTMVLEIKDASGNVVESHVDESRHVADAQSVRLVNDVLSDVETRSGLFGGSLSLTAFPGHDIALKTGTSNDYRDAWTVGYTPSLVVGVWAGNNDNTPMQRQGSSILASVPIWNAFMGEALKEKDPEVFPRPEVTAREKPVLRGEFTANKQIHSVLYTVDRDDPVGPAPQRPDDDPQFVNWEFGVLRWAEGNISDFKDYNQGLSAFVDNLLASLQNPLGPQIQIVTPRAGSYAGTGVIVMNAQFTAAKPITEIKIYWNGAALHRFSGSFPKEYAFYWQLLPQEVQLQNFLEIEAKDESGAGNRVGVIVYR